MSGVPSINITSSNEHVPDIELLIRAVKDIKRAVRHICPLNKKNEILTIYIVFTVVRVLRYLRFMGLVSANLSPKTIISGEKLHYKRHLDINIGKYCQMHKHEETRKGQLPRTKGAIFLGPSGNEQGGLRFMSINSVENITIRSWNMIPIPDTVIASVNELGLN